MKDKELKVHGVYPESNFGGTEVSIVDGEDFLFWRMNFGQEGKWNKAKIYYTRNERSYFLAGSRRIHLDEVLRIDA